VLKPDTAGTHDLNQGPDDGQGKGYGWVAKNTNQPGAWFKASKLGKLRGEKFPSCRAKAQRQIRASGPAHKELNRRFKRGKGETEKIARRNKKKKKRGD